MKVTLETTPAGPTLVLEGDVDHESVGQLTGSLHTIAESGSPRVALDLAKVTYLDSAGIAAIYSLIEKMNGGGEIDVKGVSPSLWRIFEVAGLTVQPGVRIHPRGISRGGEASTSPPGAGTREQRLRREESFPGELAQLARIRDFVGKVGVDVCLEKERIFDLQVAVSEASANAIEHGLPPGELEVLAVCAERRLTITVSHPGCFLPRIGKDPTRHHRGMGLPLMLALTDEVMVSHPLGEGTRVSLSLYLQ